MKSSVLADLQWRGLLQQCTDLHGLDDACAAAPITLYCGFDPTADSLHVGSLIPLLALARFQWHGHRTLSLVGGATGLIGDPSGKASERVLQESSDLDRQKEKIMAQLAHFQAMDPEGRALVLDNLAWTRGMDVLDFLRNIGKHFSVNAMLARDSVRSRLDREGEGISFTELSYMLLQAMDFLKLHERRGCVLQIGGSDQWGNMCSGVDLVRRKHDKQVFALTLPLLTTADGQKFGKTAKGAVWLSAELTPVWDFYQFWLNTSDADVVRFLKLFTFMPRAEIEALEAASRNAPQERQAQRQLALEVTAIVHGGMGVAQQMADAARCLFEKNTSVSNLEEKTLSELAKALPCMDLLGRRDLTVVQALVDLGLEPSVSQARRTVQDSGVHVNDDVVQSPQEMLCASQALPGGYWLVRKGKKTFALVKS